MQVEEKDLKKIFSRILKINITKVNDSLSMNNNEKWDSFNHLKLILAIEGKFQISFDDEVVTQVISYKLLKLHLKKMKITFI